MYTNLIKEIKRQDREILSLKIQSEYKELLDSDVTKFSLDALEDATDFDLLTPEQRVKAARELIDQKVEYYGKQLLWEIIELISDDM